MRQCCLQSLSHPAGPTPLQCKGCQHPSTAPPSYHSTARLLQLGLLRKMQGSRLVFPGETALLPDLPTSSLTCGCPASLCCWWGVGSSEKKTSSSLPLLSAQPCPGDNCTTAVPMSRALAALSSHSPRQLFNLAEAMLLSHFTDGELQSRNSAQAQGEGGNLQGRRAPNPPLDGSILCVFCTSCASSAHPCNLCTSPAPSAHPLPIPVQSQQRWGFDTLKGYQMEGRATGYGGLAKISLF